MEALIAYPENKAQLTALKAVMKAMKVAFEETDEVYPEYVIKGVQRATNQSNNGQSKQFTSIRNMLKGNG